jgi:TonB family protein
MLLGIYLEEGNYGRSQALLEETFVNRAAQKDESIRTYFAAAGQTINGIRAHLARYRTYGINPTDANLPVEANTDLDRVRELLERVIAQAREISKEAGRAYDALALQEDVLGLRQSIAKNDEDRGKWQTEYLTAREKMATSQAPSLGRSQAPVQTVPASTSSTPEPQLVTAGSLNGRETKRVSPNYPPTAKTHNVVGTVRVFAIVDENGKIWVTNSEGPTLLRAAAEEAARNWSFPPSTFNGKPARIAGYLDFEFKL